MEEALGTLALSTEERQNAMIEQLIDVEQLQNKNQDTAFLLELIGGIVGFLGIGYLYSGLTQAGVIRLVGLWIVLLVLGTIASLSIGSLILPVLFVLNIVLAYVSAKDLKQSIFFAKSAQMAEQNDDDHDFIGYLESARDERTAP